MLNSNVSAPSRGQRTVFLTLLILVCFPLLAAAQSPLAGEKSVGGSAPDYPNLQTAIKDLNAFGVGNGGVTFKIRTGTYSGPYTVTAKGTAQNPITFIADSGATPVLTGVSNNQSSVSRLFWIKGSHVTIHGLTFSSTKMYTQLSVASTAKNTTIRENIFEYAHPDGTAVSIWGSGCLFENNSMTILPAGATTNGYWKCGISDDAASTIRGNRIRVKDGKTTAIKLWYFGYHSGQSTVIDRNDIRCENILPGESPVGIYRSHNNFSSGPSEITNNLIAGFHIQIDMKTSSDPAVFMNNTLVAPKGQNSQSGCADIVGTATAWVNNIFTSGNSTGTAFRLTNTTTHHFNNNLFHIPGGAKTAYPGVQSLLILPQNKTMEANPQFVDLTPGQEDYRLMPTSPCIDAGSTSQATTQGPCKIPVLLVDLDGNARPNGTANDIGAYEYTAPVYALAGSAEEKGGSGNCAGSIAGNAPKPFYFFFGMVFLLGLSMTRRI